METKVKEQLIKLIKDTEAMLEKVMAENYELSQRVKALEEKTGGI